MSLTMNIDEQLAWLSRGTEAIYSAEELKQKLASGRPLRIKYGMDPTAPDIHLGHSVQMRILRRFQDLGHTVVLIIGDYTAMIGDPSGRDTTRPMLNEDQISRNAQTYLNQAGILLDTSSERLELRRNSEWLSRLTFADVLRLTGQMTVQQMLQRENFKQRIANEREIIITEFLYPLMQAYDSVAIDADVEFGGSDQTFNCLAGRDLMAKAEKPRQVVMITPLLVGLDGTEKMSKSKGNYVALTDRAEDMYGKLMSIPDALMRNYFELLTDRPVDEIHRLLDDQQTHPRDSKDALAREIVSMYHDEAAADAAAAEFRRRFSEGHLPSDMPLYRVDQSDWPLANLISHVEFASSNSEARRLIKQGAVTFADKKISDPTAQVQIPTDQPVVLKVGKRKICQVQCGG
jgi:tyrosyl-tRNA synthetase